MAIGLEWFQKSANAFDSSAHKKSKHSLIYLRREYCQTNLVLVHARDIPEGAHFFLFGVWSLKVM